MNTRVFFSEMLFKTLVAFMWCSTTRGGGCGCTWQRKKQWKYSEHVIVKRVIQMTCPWSRHSSRWKSCHISKLLLKSDQLSLANSPSKVFTLSIFWNCISCLLLNWFWCSNWALHSKHPANLSYHQNLPNSLTNIFELLAASHSVYPITANQLFPISIMHHPVQSLVVTNRDLSWNDVISPSLRRTSLYSRSSLFSSISPLDK